MFVYEKKLQYPVKIATPNPKLASVIITQYGGPDGELGASLRYLSQRYAMPYPELKGVLTDIGTEGSFWHTDFKPLQSKGFSDVGLEVKGGIHRILQCTRLLPFLGLLDSGLRPAGFPSQRPISGAEN